MTKQALSLLIGLCYTIIIGIGMFLMKKMGYTYGNPDMVNVLFWVEIVLTIFTLFVTFKYYGWREFGFGHLNKRHLLWFIIPVVFFIYVWIHIINKMSIQDTINWKLFIAIGISTFMVGFTEEIVYRGIILRSFLKSQPVWLAMLISTIAFSLLHSVNYFGGLTLPAVGAQLYSTFLFGLFFVPLVYLTNNLWPLIIYHWLWDFMLIGGTMFTDFQEVGVIYQAYMYFTYALTLVLWILVILKDKKIRALRK